MRLKRNKVSHELTLTPPIKEKNLKREIETIILEQPRAYITLTIKEKNLKREIETDSMNHTPFAIFPDQREESQA